VFNCNHIDTKTPRRRRGECAAMQTNVKFKNSLQVLDQYILTSMVERFK